MNIGRMDIGQTDVGKTDTGQTAKRSAPITQTATNGVVASLARVSKRYGKVQALKEVSLEVRAGEIVAVLGPNGAGKTTAVSLMLGLLAPTRGTVRLFGGDPRAASSRTRVGAMLQISGVPETLRVREHLELFSSYYPQPLALEEVVRVAGLTGLERRAYGALSGGQKRRLHFALALCGDPDLLFLDEPTAGLDAAARRAFWKQIRDFVGRGKTAVLTTHYLEEADALADRIVVISGGELIAAGTPAAIKAGTAGRRVRCVTRLRRDEVAGLPGVSAAAHDGAALTLLVAEAEPVVRELLRRDPDLRGLEVSDASLEEAFFALTETREKVSA